MLRVDVPRSLRYSPLVVVAVWFLATATGCGPNAQSAQRQSEQPAASAANSSPTVSVALVQKQHLQTSLTLSSELVPFQEIDVYAKEAGYIKQLLVDYGTACTKDNLWQFLKFQNCRLNLQEDQATIKVRL